MAGKSIIKIVKGRGVIMSVPIKSDKYVRLDDILNLLPRYSVRDIGIFPCIPEPDTSALMEYIKSISIDSDDIGTDEPHRTDLGIGVSSVNAFNFWKETGENIYTDQDGEPISSKIPHLCGYDKT